MNNIPVFLSQGGTATLVLSEIPFSKKAYIYLRTVRQLALLIEESAAFCRQCGAETCFLTGSEETPHLPLRHAFDVLLLSVEKRWLPEQPLVPLTQVTAGNDQVYLSVYNQCFRNISGAITYDQRHLQRIVREQQQAFLALCPDGTPWGMGELHENELAAVAVLPEFRGRGAALTYSLLQHCPGPKITLSVASDNRAALALYEKLGFHVSGLQARWYLK